MNKELTATWEEKISPLVIALFLKHGNGTFIQNANINHFNYLLRLCWSWLAGSPSCELSTPVVVLQLLYSSR